MSKETIEYKVLSFCFSSANETVTRREFTSEIEKRFGKDAKKTAIELWNKGCFKFNKYGYVNLSERGFTFWHEGELPPKRKPRETKLC